MKVIIQPLGSNICGHCCLAMVSGRSIKTAIKMIGHENPASTKELVLALNRLKIKNGGKLKQVFKYTTLPKKAILKVTYPGKHKSHWHWVAYNDGYIHDSSFRRGGIYISSDISTRYLVPVKISSYLEIF